MEQHSLLMVCVASFVAVFVVLTFLAATMRVLMRVFPDKGAGIDPATLAAITSAASAAYPESRVTDIQEKK
jgi:hypothetical protein